MSSVGDAQPLNPPQGRCEGIFPPAGTRGYIFCDGGTGLWVTRRARWFRNGYGQCGTCKREQDQIEEARRA